MGKHEIVVPYAPPPLRAVAVERHLAIAKQTLAMLEQSVPALLLSVAESHAGADAALATVQARIAEARFAVDYGSKTVAHVRGLDQFAFQEWKAQVQTLPAEKIIEGISKDACCRRCVPGSVCALTGSDPFAGGVCAHPLKAGQLNAISSRDNPQVMAVFAAACNKLGKAFR